VFTWLDTFSESTVHDFAAPVLATLYTASPLYGYVGASLFISVLTWRVIRHGLVWYGARAGRKARSMFRELDDVYTAGMRDEAQAEQLAAAAVPAKPTRKAPHGYRRTADGALRYSRFASLFPNGNTDQ
jgi:hypothetical protein